jgi:hypothetical protein
MTVRSEPQGRKAKLITRHHKHSPQKRRNGGIPGGYSEQTALRRQQCGM